MLDKIKALLKGKTFEDLITIYEGFTAKAYNFDIEIEIMQAMAKLDHERFEKWAEESDIDI